MNVNFPLNLRSNKSNFCEPAAAKYFARFDTNFLEKRKIKITSERAAVIIRFVFTPNEKVLTEELSFSNASVLAQESKWRSLFVFVHRAKTL